MLGSLNPFSQRESHALEILGRRGKERSSTWSSVRRRSSRNCFRYCPKRQLPFCAIPRCPRGCCLLLGNVPGLCCHSLTQSASRSQAVFLADWRRLGRSLVRGDDEAGARLSDLATACRVEVEEEHLATGDGRYRHCHSSWSNRVGASGSAR